MTCSNLRTMDEVALIGKSRSYASRIRAPIASLLLLIVGACGGSSGGHGPTSFTIGVTVSGLTGSGLVLQNNGTGSLAVSANGNFSFPGVLASGTSYQVSVVTQPSGPAQSCAVSGGTGIVANSNIDAIVTCTTHYPRFAYGVSGLIFAVDAQTGQLRPRGRAVAPGANLVSAVAVDPSGRFAYFANAGSATVSALAIDQTSGALNEINGSPFAAGQLPVSVSVDPTGKFVYAVASGIWAYTMDQASGALTAVSGSPFGSSSSPYDLVIDPSGKFAYAISSNAVLAFAVNQSTGALSAINGSPYAIKSPNTYSGGRSLAVAPSGKFIYIASTNGLLVFAIDQTSGALSPAAGPYAAGGAVAVDPSGQAVFALDGGAIYGFSINQLTGALTEVSGSPFPVVSTPMGGGTTISIDPSGEFAYVTVVNYPSYLQIFAIDRVSNALTSVGLMNGAGAQTYTGVGGFAFTEGPSALSFTSKYAFVANNVSNDVSVFLIDSTNGALSMVSGSPFAVGSAPSSVAVDPSGMFAYVANSRSNNVSAFSVNQASGVLSGVAGSPFTAGSAPSSVAVDPTQGIVYVANSASNTVSVFAMNQASGALSPLNDPLVNLPFTAGTSPNSVAIVPTGGCILAANKGSNNVSVFSVNAIGYFGCGQYGPFAAGPGPSSVAIDPSGKFAYVTNSSSDYISQYRIAVPVDDFMPDNALTPVSNPAAGSAPASVTVDPTGRFVYAANSGSNDVSAFSIDPYNGVLIPVGGSPYPAGTAPSSVTVDSSGKFVYVTNASSNNISGYSINQSTGALSTISGSPFATGSGPVSIAISELIQ